MKNKEISSSKIAAAYIGTVVGAGFASGQEVLQFFGYFRYWGIVALIISGFLFYYFGTIILKLGQELDADSHLPVIEYAGGKFIGKFIDYVIIFFLFGALTAMAAGAGAIFAEQFQLSSIVGSGLLILITLVTVLAGISGVISAISIVVPLLLVSVFGISLYTLVVQGISMQSLAVIPGKPAVPVWPLSSIVYVSYNLVMAVAILGPLGKEGKNKHRLRLGALWGGMGLGIGALAILVAVLATVPESARYEIPMIYVAGQISPLVQKIYSVVLIAEIYTTAVSSLYGFVVRLIAPDNKKLIRYVAIGTSIVALLASQLGFSNLVRVLYPLVGYAGLLMLGGLLYREIQRKKLTIIPAPAMRAKNSNEKIKDEENKMSNGPKT